MLPQFSDSPAPVRRVPALGRSIATLLAPVAVVLAGLSSAASARADDTITILHPFAGGPDDGANPYTSLTLSGSYLYGTTRYGGDGGGVIFRIDTDGSGYTILHQFAAGSDGEFPNTVTISGSTIYGTADYAGASGLGTAYSMNSDGSDFTVLHNFVGGPSDGSFPTGSLLLSGSTLYGTTETGGTTGSGGHGYGTIFQMNTNGSGYSVLRNFGYTGDGESPEGLILSGSTLYGTTYYSSTNEGTVFAMNTSGTGYTVLHTFPIGGSDGILPSSVTLVGSALYGVTNQGGSNGEGIIFSVNTNGTGYRELYSFNLNAFPFSSGLTYANGKLYGTTDSGGADQDGILYSINLDGSGFTILHSFTDTPDAAFGGSGLVASSDGSTLYGTTIGGGASGNGTIFSTAPSSPITTTPATGPIIQNAAPVGTPLNADFTVTGAVTTGGPADNNTIYSLEIAPGGTLTIHNTLSLTGGNVTTSSGTASIKGGTLSSSNGLLIFNVDGNLTVGSTLSTRRVAMNGPGVLTITSSNTYSGGTMVSPYGTLVFTNGNALGTGLVALSDGTELRGSGNIVLNNRIDFDDWGSVSATAGSTVTYDYLNVGFATVGFGSVGNTGTVLIGRDAMPAAPGATLDVVCGTLGNAGSLDTLTSTARSTTVGLGARLALDDINTQVNHLTSYGSVTLGSKASTILTLIGSADIEGGVSGAGIVVVAGNAYFNSRVTYTGGTFITANSSLVIGASGSLAGNVTLDASSSALCFEGDSGSKYTFGGVISGPGNVQQIGDGVVTLTGRNTYSGGTVVNSGVLAFSGAQALGTGPITLDPGAELHAIGNITLANPVTFGNLSPSTSTAISTTGILTLNSLDCTNAATINFVGESILPSGALPTPIGMVVPPALLGTIVVDAVSNVTSGTTVEVSGGTLRNGRELGVLTGNAGSTWIAPGAVLAVNDISMTVNCLQGYGSVNLGTKAATRLTLRGTTQNFGVISGAGQVEVTGDALFTGANTYTGGTTVDANSILQLGGSIVGNVYLASNAEIEFARTNAYSFAGAISGPGFVSQQGPGVLMLTGHSTYSGGTLVTGGVLAFNTANALGTGAVTLDLGVELRAIGNITLNNPVQFNALPNSATTISARGGTLTLNHLDTSGTTGVTFGSPGNTGTVAIGPEVTAGQNIDSVLVAFGTLQNAGGLGALTSPSLVTVEPGATLALNDLSATIGSLSGSGSVTLGSKASTVLTLENNAFSGVISGAGRVVIAGMFNYLGANTYTGGTTVMAQSTLNVGVDTNTGSLAGNVILSDFSSVLNFDRANAYTCAGSISGSGSVEQTGSGVLTLTGKSSYSGGTAVTNGVLAFNSAAALGTGPVTLSDSSFIGPFGGELLGSGNITLNNLVEVTGIYLEPIISATKGSTLVLNHLEIDGRGVAFGDGSGGTGTVVIGPGVTLDSNYQTIFVTSGTLQNGGGLGALASRSSFVLSSGATLALKDISVTLALDGSGSVNLGGNSATVLTLDGGDFEGTISGAGQVNVTGRVFFEQANTYSGGTTVTQHGTLLLRNPFGSATGTGPVTIDNGGTIGGSGTVSGPMTVNSGGLIEPGLNSLTVPGTKFHGSSLLWNGGGSLEFQIGSTSDELLLSGALTKGATGAFDLDILDAGISPGTYTLVTFASTTFAPADFTLQFPDTLPAGDNASLTESGKSLVLTITHSQLPAHLDASASSELSGSVATDETPFAGAVPLTPAPEPASALLLGIGSCALLGWRRRRCRPI